MIAIYAFAAVKVLTLQDAVRLADQNQPTIRQARANIEVARARQDEARAPLLPQLSGTASYQRTTANFVARPGFVPLSTATSNTTAPTWRTFDFWNFGLTLTQYIWDFGQTTEKWNASKVTTRANEESEHFQRLQVEELVRAAFFNARAQKALVEVGRETLDNYDRHLVQTTAFVKAGRNPEIDLAQARSDRANALVQLINAENNYDIAKAQLNQQMGIEGTTDYDVADDELGTVIGEDQTTDQMMDEALHNRPDILAFDYQIRAQEYIVRSFKGAYGPSLSAQMSLTDSGTDITNLGWNWSVQVNVNWPLFQGLLTWSQVREQKAQLEVLKAQRDQLAQQARLDVDTARLAVRAAKATIRAADEALANARERLRLAEGRYNAGVGNAIELGDAQVAVTQSAAQRVQAAYNLSTARAQLVRALGRRE